MSSQIQVSDLICQSCLKRIPCNEYLTSIVNLDTISYECDYFYSGELNRVQCPHCKNTFTAEIPMMIFSESMKYACVVMPNLEECGIDALKPPPLFLVKDFELRAVRYQAEALEKFRIKSNLLDDAVIEYIKYIKFDDDDALPFSEKTLIFEKVDGDVYHIMQTDFNNNVMSRYQVKFPDFLIPDFIRNYNKNLSNKKWHKTDRITIREEINNAKI